MDADIDGVDEFYEETGETDSDEEVTSEVDDSLQEEEPAEAEAVEPEEGLTISLSGAQEEEEDTKGAPEWVKELRKSHKELQRENRELRERFKSAEGQQIPSVGEKPTLASCEFDTERFEQSLIEWHEAKRQVDAYRQQAEQQQRQHEQAWQEKVNAYSRTKSELKLKDFDEAEENVKDALNATQQGVLLQGADRPAHLIYALGKNPKVLRELSAISDIATFAFRVSKMEAGMNVSSKKEAPPAPERALKGSGKAGGGSEAKLDKLREEARKTGDMSKLMEYKRQLKR